MSALKTNIHENEKIVVNHIDITDMEESNSTITNPSISGKTEHRRSISNVSNHSYSNDSISYTYPSTTINSRQSALTTSSMSSNNNIETNNTFTETKIETKIETKMDTNNNNNNNNVNNNTNYNENILFIDEKEFSYDWAKITQVDPATVKVRSKTYLTNRVKKPANKDVLLPLVHCQCLRTNNNEKLDNVALNPISWYYQNYNNFKSDTFILILQLQIPTINASFISYYQLKHRLTKPFICQKIEQLNNRKTNQSNNNNELSVNSRASINDSISNIEHDMNDIYSTNTSYSNISDEMTDDTVGNSNNNSNYNINNNNNNSDNKDDSYDKRLNFFYDNLLFVTNNDIRKRRFKFIPNIKVGPFIVRKSVENKPIMIAKKLPHHWYSSLNIQNNNDTNNNNANNSIYNGNNIDGKNSRNINYLELDVQVDDSMAASAILKLCYSYSKRLIVDMSWLLQCENSIELPESIMCGITIHHLDFDKVLNINQLYKQYNINNSEISQFNANMIDMKDIIDKSECKDDITKLQTAARNSMDMNANGNENGNSNNNNNNSNNNKKKKGLNLNLSLNSSKKRRHHRGKHKKGSH